MAITKNPGRQEVIAAKLNFTLGTGRDVDAQGLFPAIDLPQGAVVVGGHIAVKTATSASVTISIGDTVLATRYASAVNGAAVARTALTLTGYTHPVATTINFTVAGATPVTAGVAEVVIEYIVDGRAAFSQG
jgi:hypothetical protein